ncbi:MAG: hypothetical protein R2825_18090 [Saprospiraceae bacterium]
MKKLKITASLLLSIFLSFPLISQKPTCERNLERAVELFQAGRYQDIDSLLASCENSGDLNTKQRQTATELTAQVALLEKNYDRANDKIVSLLKNNPYYATESEIPELAHFARRYKSWSVTMGSSMGLQFAPVSFAGNYDLPGVRTNSQETRLSGLAFLTVWAGADFFESDNFEVIAEFKNAPTQYLYSSALQIQMPVASSQNANLNFEEFTMWLELNLLANYHFPIKKLSFGDRVNYYAQFGGGYTWMRESRFENIVLDPSWQDEKTRLDALIITREGESLRRMDNYTLHAGLGFTYRISHYLSIYGQGRYSLRLQNLVNEKNRSGNPTLTDNFYYLDDDMLLHGISFSAGVRLTHCFNWKHK